MTRSKKIIPDEFFHPVTLIGLSTMILWFMAASGWRLAINAASQHYRYEEEINLPSFYLTLLVLPLPYMAFRLYESLTHKYSTVDWKAWLASSIFYGLILSVVLQGFVLCPLFLIGPGAGAMDFMVSWTYEAVINSSLWGSPVALLTVLLTFNRKKDIQFLLWSLPAVITGGIIFFELVFLAEMSPRLLP